MQTFPAESNAYVQFKLVKMQSLTQVHITIFNENDGALCRFACLEMCILSPLNTDYRLVLIKPNYD